MHVRHQHLFSSVPYATHSFRKRVDFPAIFPVTLLAIRPLTVFATAIFASARARAARSQYCTRCDSFDVLARPRVIISRLKPPPRWQAYTHVVVLIDIATSRLAPVLCALLPLIALATTAENFIEATVQRDRCLMRR